MAKKKKQELIQESFSSAPKEHLSIRQRIKCIEELETDIRSSLPGEVTRMFTDISIFGSQICFSSEGDYLTLDEAIRGVKLLLKELERD